MSNTKVYVGTYGKYNSGKFSGGWLSLSSYHNQEEFLEACKALHPDEDDPEFMFMDTEGPTLGMVEESSIDPELFSYVNVLDTGDMLMFDAYLRNVGCGSFRDAQEAFCGQYKDDEDFAYSMAHELGNMNEKDSWPYTCIDWKQAARELMYDYFSQDGYYFRNY